MCRNGGKDIQGNYRHGRRFGRVCDRYGREDKETLEEGFPDGRSLGRRRPGLPRGTWQGRGGVYPGEFYVEGFLVGYPV